VPAKIAVHSLGRKAFFVPSFLGQVEAAVFEAILLATFAGASFVGGESGDAKKMIASVSVHAVAELFRVGLGFILLVWPGLRLVLVVRGGKGNESDAEQRQDEKEYPHTHISHACLLQSSATTIPVV
jgi:hypothetical protein